MLVMEVIVRLQDRALCASITCITGTYAEPEGRVIFDHRHNADVRMLCLDRLCLVSPPSLHTVSAGSVAGRGLHGDGMLIIQHWDVLALGEAPSECEGLRYPAVLTFELD